VKPSYYYSVKERKKKEKLLFWVSDQVSPWCQLAFKRQLFINAWHAVKALCVGCFAAVPRCYDIFLLEVSLMRA